MPAIEDKHLPGSQLGRLIESGTGLSIPPALPLNPVKEFYARQEDGRESDTIIASDPCKDFDARQASWRAAEPYIQKLETITDADEKEKIDRSLLRFAILRLADLALIAHRVVKKTPVRLSTVARRLTPPAKKERKRANLPVSRSEEFALLHLSADRAGRSGESRTRASHRPSYANILSVLSGLAWYLEYHTTRLDLTLLVDLLVDLLRCVHPPIFILRGRRREARRQLSDVIRKYRRKKMEKKTTRHSATP